MRGFVRSRSHVTLAKLAELPRTSLNGGDQGSDAENIVLIWKIEDILVMFKEILKGIF